MCNSGCTGAGSEGWQKKEPLSKQCERSQERTCRTFTEASVESCEDDRRETDVETSALATSNSWNRK